MPELTPEGQPGGGDVAVLDEPIVRTSRQARADEKKNPKKPKRQPPYAVIVHDDDHHTYEYVIECLQRVCGHPLEKAFELTKQIDQSGQAIVWSGPKEVAELKRDQIRGFGPDFHASTTVTFPLGVTIEPLPGE